MKTKVATVTIKDCEVQHFRAGGPGGQHQNKTSSGSRVIHHPSGARGESREERSQPLNTRKAFLRMAESQKFKLWVNQIALGKTPEERVEEDMKPHNLKVEVRTAAGWDLPDAATAI